jgi:8-oxo-dGTP pyrophosphatase MutT (NUDIX family)
MNNDEAKAKISKLYSDKHYRPVGVALIYRIQKDEIEFIIVQSSKSLSSWYFPQGGIELDESLKQNMSRELKEELEINLGQDIVNIHYAYFYSTLDAEATRNDKRGFSKGKAYFFNLMNYVGKSKFKLQEEEIADAKWVNYSDAIQYFNIGRKEKANLSTKALKRATSIIKKENKKK